MGRRTIDPYRQGSLDALCGMYAIVNAINLCLPRSNTRNDICVQVFEDMIWAASGRMAAHMVRGLYVQDISVFLSSAQRTLHKWSLRLSYHRPFVRERTLRQSQYLGRLAQFLEVKNRSCIVSIGHPMFRHHWTAVNAITPRTLRLTDSCNERVIRVRNLVTVKRCRQGSARSWMPTASFVIELAREL